MLPAKYKMAISHGSHLFVPVTFVFCFLLPLIHVSDSHDYTDSTQFEKNPSVSRHRKNIQRLPNYNWKPPDKYYGPKYSGKPQKELTKKNLGMEFTKPENPEQRMADPWIKKMQEISRQEREKWAEYRRNVKLTLDNVEETTKAGKLTNDKSITVPILSKSKEYHKNIEERSALPIKLFEKSESLKANHKLDSIISPLAQHPSVKQDSAGVKDDSFGNQFQNSSWSNSKQSADINIAEASNKKFKSKEWNINMKNSSKKFLQKASNKVTHQRHKDYEISDIKEDLSFKRNTATDYKKSELEEDHPSSIVNSHPEESILQQFKDSHTLKNSMNTHKNFTKFSENDKNLNHITGSKKSVKKYSKQFNSFQDNKKKSSNDNKKNKGKTVDSLMQKSKKNGNVNSHSEKSISQQSIILQIPKGLIDKNLKKISETSKNLNHKIDSKLSVKEYPTQSSPSQNDTEENNEDSKKDNEKTITVKSLMWKSKEEKDDAGGKNVIEKLNHEKLFHSDRWGTSILSPPTNFLEDVSQRSKHRKNKKQIEKDGKRLFDQWGMSVALPPKEFVEDISMHREHGTKGFTTRTRSRPNEIKGSSNDRPPIHQSHENLQTNLVQQELMTDERYKKPPEILLGKVPNDLYDSRSPNPNYWNNYSTNTDLNKGLFLKFLQVLWSYVWQNDVDIPMSCHI